MPTTHLIPQTTLSDQTTDADLVKLAAAGETRAFERVMRRHNRLLFRTARSILKSDTEAEDALQETYLRSWRALKTFRSDAKLSTWLVRIVVNESLGRLRKRGAQIVPLDASSELAAHETQIRTEQNSSTEPEPVAMNADMRRLIESRIDTLPEVFRTVFVLRAVEELSVEEVAAALDIPEATVRTRFFRARSLLREGLSR
ncbi:MAG: RNA polymerase sigma factor, partial [Steroidobacter sp.]